MASTAAENAVRNYLTAIKDPKGLRDDKAVASLEKKLAEATDQIERVKLQQQLQEASNPSTDQFEEEFVTHAKKWAEDHGITAAAFLAEGVPAAVLHRAGFAVRGGGRARGARRPRGRGAGTRTRVSAEDVRKAIPKGEFTIKQVQDASGGSVAVVRRVIQEEVEGGRVQEVGSDPNHKGPGRAPTMYKR